MRLLLALLAACQPGAERPDDRPCPELPVAEGEVWVGSIVCSSQRFPSSTESRNSDYWIANSRFRVVVRHPQHALSLAGVSGGTIIDAAPWDRSDQLLEAAPLINGGWLSVDDLEVEADAITLHGTLAALPDRPNIAGIGDRHAVTYRVKPDDPWLYFEGSDGLWLHPNLGQALRDGWLWSSRAVIGHDGTIEEDLGGALRLAGVSRMLIAEPIEAMAAKSEDQQRISGASDGTDVVLYRGEEIVGVIPTADDAYAAMVPADIDGVRSLRAGHAPSRRAAPSENVALPVGAQGILNLRVAWEDATARPIRMQWTATDGRSSELKLDPLGELIPLGTGVYDIELSAGPTVEKRTLRVELLPDERANLGVTMRGLFDPGSRIYASLQWPGSRSRTVRGTESTRTRQAMLRGMQYIVSVAEDTVSERDVFLTDGGWIRADTGARLQHPDGWSISAWPWGDQPRQAGYGAPAVAPLDPLRSLGIAWGGVNTNRRLAPSLTWFQQFDEPPWTFDPQPTYVDLPSPGQPPFLRWSTWFDWLDADRFLLPSGPRHWIDVRDASRFGNADIQRAVNIGAYNAGTGPWLDLRVETAGPGEVLQPEPDAERPVGPTEYRISISAHAAQTDIRHVALVTNGGRIVSRWELHDGELHVQEQLAVEDWVVAIAWSDSTAHWAVTSPVWTWPLGTGAPQDTGDTSGDTSGDTRDSGD